MLSASGRLEGPTDAQLTKEFFPFMESEMSLLCSEDPLTPLHILTP
jgi:hypothetical protein